MSGSQELKYPDLHEPAEPQSNVTSASAAPSNNEFTDDEIERLTGKQTCTLFQYQQAKKNCRALAGFARALNELDGLADSPMSADELNQLKVMFAHFIDGFQDDNHICKSVDIVAMTEFTNYMNSVVKREDKVTAFTTAITNIERQTKQHKKPMHPVFGMIVGLLIATVVCGILGAVAGAVLGGGIGAIPGFFMGIAHGLMVGSVSSIVLVSSIGFASVYNGLLFYGARKDVEESNAKNTLSPYIDEDFRTMKSRQQANDVVGQTIKSTPG